MTYCTRFNDIISSDSRAFGIANGLIGDLFVYSEEIDYDRLRTKARETVEELLERAFPVGGPFATVTNGDVVNAVLFRIWGDIVASSQQAGFKIELNITSFGEGADLRKCWSIELIPLTTDEAGSEEDPNENPPENPFQPPDILRPGEDPPDEEPPGEDPPDDGRQDPTTEDRPPSAPPPRQPPPTPPIPPPTTPPRQPPPDSGEEREDRGESDRTDEPGEDDEEPESGDGTEIPLPSPGEVGEFDDSEIVELLKQIRDNITRQGELDRQQAGDLNQELVKELNEIDDLLKELDTDLQTTIQQTIEETTNAVLDILESVVIENEVTVEVVTEAVNVALNLQPLIEEIRNHGDKVVENATDGFNRLITAIDTGLSNGVVAFNDLMTGLREELESDFNKLVDQSKENLEGWTDYITGLVTFDDEQEIAEWVCRMLKFYRDLFQTCDLTKPRE